MRVMNVHSCADIIAHILLMNDFHDSTCGMKSGLDLFILS